MKKIIIICFTLLLGVFAACSSSTETKTENTEENAAPIREDATVAESESMDTTQYACNCAHKCKTAEECKEHCGEECMNHQ